MGKIEHVGRGLFIDTEEVAAPDDTEDSPDVHIYAYARFRSLEHVSFGLFRTTGGPKDEEIDSENVGQYGMEPLASYWEFGDAIHDIQKETEAVERGQRVSKDPRWFFEENPFVEVTSEKDYEEALDALGLDPDDSAWEKPGLYDFRDDPPTFQGTVEEYELDEMKHAADDAIEFMFQGDEWEDAWRELAAEEEED